MRGFHLEQHVKLCVENVAISTLSQSKALASQGSLNKGQDIQKLRGVPSGILSSFIDDSKLVFVNCVFGGNCFDGMKVTEFFLSILLFNNT